MNYDFTILVEQDTKGFYAHVPVLDGCHSHGETVEEAKKNIAEAIEFHLECMLEDGKEIPIDKGLPFTLRVSVPDPVPVAVTQKIPVVNVMEFFHALDMHWSRSVV